MISYLEGKLIDKSGDRVTISVHGTGYEVLVPAGTLARLPSVGKEAQVYTRLHVRDDALVLYGFSSTEERGLFDMLVTVNGVGPKVALAFLSVLSPEAFRRAVAAGDAAALTVVPGVGKKVAARVLIDLRDRLGGPEGIPAGPLGEVREALLALGLSAQEASDAMADLVAGNGHADRPVEELLREALRRVGR
ncbi:MAG: Holliday junction branch migration protein RuvA [Actinobacteria bacterium]|nr:Holliday junction branch migration protein RuvA [Actinomycetota bacterium]